MSSRTAAARKRLQVPLLRTSSSQRSANQPESSTTGVHLVTSTLSPPDAPRMRAGNFQQLDLANEFIHSLPTPEYSPNYYFPPSNHLSFNNIESVQAIQAVSSYNSPQISSDTKPKRIVSGQMTRTAPTYDFPSSYEGDSHQHRPLLRVDPYVANHQHLPPPPSPRFSSLKSASPATVSFPYVPDLPILPHYPQPSLNQHSDHVAPSHVPQTPSYVRRSNRVSLTPSDLPEYRSVYSSVEGHVPVAITTLNPTGGTSYQHPPTSASTSSLPRQLARLSIAPRRIKTSPLFPNLPRTPNSINNNSASSSHSSHELERPGDSASLSGSCLSSPTPSTPTSNGTWLPPAPPPSPNFYFPGSRSIARPKVSSKITNSQFKKRRSKSKLRAGGSQISPVSSISPISPPYAFDMVSRSPNIQPSIKSNHPDASDDGGFVLSDDYKQQSGSSVPKPPPEKFIFPTARSRAQPKALSRPKYSKSHNSLNSRDDDQRRPRFMETLFKRKNKVKTPNLVPISKMYNALSDSVASTVEITAPIGKRTSAESSSGSTSITGHQGRTRRVKLISRRGSYPLDPYNSVSLDNDRHTGELLSRLNSTGSPSFHDYGTSPPSSVLDLGCGQGHWVLEAAIAWKEHSTHVTGYDMVDISRNLLPWATEQGVRDNIRFVRGNFLKQQLPFSSNTFDLVRMSCLALCVPSDSWGFLLQEVCRVLVAGGRLELIDDQMFFPYGKVSSTMDDTIAESDPSKLNSVLSPMVSTFSIHGDAVVNPGLGSTVGLRRSDDDDDDDDESDLDGEIGALHSQKGKAKSKRLTIQPRVKPSIILTPEAWDRSVSIAEDLEALFEHMLLDVFDIHKDPSEFILPLMSRVFGQAREVETMNLVLAPPTPTSKLDPFFEGGLSSCPGFILWPSTFIPMDHNEVEIHTSKHLRTLLSCKNSLTQHAKEVAGDERVDDEFISEALWEYESFLRNRFNPPIRSSEYADDEGDAISIRESIAESTNDAMYEIQSEFRQRFAWRLGKPPNTEGDTISRAPSPPVASPSVTVTQAESPATPDELTHVRTFRVYEAIKLDNYVLAYDGY